MKGSSISNIFLFAGLAVSAIMYYLSFFCLNITLVIVSLFVLFISISIYAFLDVEKRLLLLLFQISMLNFMLGSIFCNFLIGNKSGLEKLTSESTAYYTVCIIGISEVFTALGFWISEKRHIITIHKEKKVFPTKGKEQCIRKISGILLIISSISIVLVECEKVLFVHHAGYLNYYKTFASAIPYFIIKLSQGFKVFLYIYLFSKPSKIPSFTALGLNLLINGIALIYGKRNPFFIAMFMTLLYLFYRNKTDKKKWISKNIFWIGIILFPVMIALLQIYSSFRSGIVTNDSSVFDLIIQYFSTSSEKVIAYGRDYMGSFPDKNYTFGSIWQVLVKNNSIYLDITDSSPLIPQTISMALNGNIYGQTLAYLVMPRIFLSGGTIGSSYIAEAYHDYLYFGVIIFSILYGFLMHVLYNSRGNNIYLNVIAFLMMEKLIFAPRDALFAFIYNTFSITNIFILLVFAIMIKLLIRKGAVHESNCIVD